LGVSELRSAYVRAKARMPSVRVPSRLRIWWEQMALFQANQLCDSRRDLARFWTTVRWRLSHGRIEALLRLDQIALNAYRELRLASAFLKAMATEAH
jgi:hypothetical protein